MKSESRYDIFFVGAGVAGYSGALYAAQQGLKVGIADPAPLGGVCTHKGCIPTKFLFSVAKSLSKLHKLRAKVELDFSRLRIEKQKITEKLAKDIEFLFKRAGVNYFPTKVLQISGECVRLEDGTQLYADNIVVATGSLPRKVEGFTVDGHFILNSEHLFELENLPGNILVVGGGYIGMELSTILTNFGVRVTVAEVAPEILSNADPKLVKRFKSFLRRQYPDLRILTNTKPVLVSREEAGVKVRLQDEEEVFDKVLVVAGRVPFVPFDILEGIEKGNSKIQNYRLNSKVFVAGDAAGYYQLAYTAEEEAKQIVQVILGKRKEVNIELVPYTIFTIPEISWIGYTANAEREYRFNYLASGKALSDLAQEGSVIAYTTADGIITGAAIVGEYATELVHLFGLMIRKQMTVAEIENMIFSHPTYSEIVKKIFD